MSKKGRGIVKSIVSGDTIIIKGRAVNGPPPEKIISFSNVEAPKLGTQADPSREEVNIWFILIYKSLNKILNEY